MGARSVVVLASAAMLLVACSSDPPDPAASVVERDWDLIGEVTAATFGGGYAHEPTEWVTGAGGPGWDFDFRVGPMTLTMSDGTTLDVPPRTPGGNSCKVLLTDEDKAALTGFPDPTEQMVDEQFGPGGGECWIVAATAADGHTVEWFQVMPGSDAGVGVGGAVAVDESGLLTDQGWRFPYAEGEVTVSATCGEDATLSEAIRQRRYPEVVVRRDGTVLSITCPGRA